MRRICIMTLIGLPAAGKTTFSKWLLQSSELNVFHVCYDNILPPFNVTEKEANYKKQRHNVLNLMSLLIKAIETEQNISKLKFPMDMKLCNSSSDYLIICDDNHYYRSMRYELYRKARLHNLSYMQIYFDCTMALALSRNDERFSESKVHPDVIYNMCEKLEQPLNNSATWEKNTLVLKSEQLNKNNVEQVVFPYVTEAFKTPLTPFVKLDAAPRATSQSMVHKLDLLLRKRIKEIVEDIEIVGEKRQKAELLNRRRKEIIHKFVNSEMNLLEDSNELLHFVKLL